MPPGDDRKRQPFSRLLRRLPQHAQICQPCQEYQGETDLDAFEHHVIPKVVRSFVRSFCKGFFSGHFQRVFASLRRYMFVVMGGTISSFVMKGRANTSFHCKVITRRCAKALLSSGSMSSMGAMKTMPGTPRCVFYNISQ